MQTIFGGRGIGASKRRRTRVELLAARRIVGPAGDAVERVRPAGNHREQVLEARALDADYLIAGDDARFAVSSPLNVHESQVVLLETPILAKIGAAAFVIIRGGDFELVNRVLCR